MVTTAAKQAKTVFLIMKKQACHMGRRQFDDYDEDEWREEHDREERQRLRREKQRPRSEKADPESPRPSRHQDDDTS